MGCLCFVTLMHGWACIDYGPQLAAGQLDRPLSMHAHPCINFHKKQATMFNYYYTMIPHLFLFKFTPNT